MPVCGLCGSPPRPGGRFCPGCGAEVGPPPAPPSTRAQSIWVLPAAALAAVVLVGVFVLLAVQLWSTGPTGPPSVPAVPSASSVVPVAALAIDRLTATIRNDSAAVEGLVGGWVPQVSSKGLGMIVGRVTYGYEDIDEDHRRWVSRYPQALLLRSDDYSTFSTSGYWVTVVSVRFASADQANAWCESEGLAATDCFAKFLSHTAGPAGATVHRR